MIRIQKLGKTFGDVRALQGVDLSVDRGEVCCLFGTNGSGRSTLLRILATLVRPDEGSVEIAGLDARRHPISARRHIGYVGPARDVVDDMRVLEYLDFLAGARGLRGADRKTAVDQALARSGVGPQSSLRDLSDGSARRLALAAALLHAPGVVLIDGPLLHLDPVGQRDLRRWIADARQQGSSVVVAANSTDEGLDLWTRGVVLHRGRLVKVVDPQDGAAGLSDLLAGL